MIIAAWRPVPLAAAVASRFLRAASSAIPSRNLPTTNRVRAVRFDAYAAGPAFNGTHASAFCAVSRAAGGAKSGESTPATMRSRTEPDRSSSARIVWPMTEGSPPQRRIESS